MRTYIPVSTIAEGMGLNVTVHSYLDELEFGLIACRELVPDLWHMVDLHLDEIDVLFAAAGVGRHGDAAERRQARRRRRRRGRRGRRRRSERTPKATPADAKAPGEKAAAKKAAAKKARPDRRRPRRSGHRREGHGEAAAKQAAPARRRLRPRRSAARAPRVASSGDAARRVDHRGARRRGRRAGTARRRVGPPAGRGVRHLRHRPPPRSTVSSTAPLGTVPGHEFVGTLLDAPAGTPDVRYAGSPMVVCGTCEHCVADELNLCRRGGDLIGIGRDGGLASWVDVPVANLVPLSADVGPGRRRARRADGRRRARRRPRPARAPTTPCSSSAPARSVC